MNDSLEMDFFFQFFSLHVSRLYMEITVFVTKTLWSQKRYLEINWNLDEYTCNGLVFQKEEKHVMQMPCLFAI